MVQGFGNVGSNTAAILAALGVSLVAVGDHTGYLYNPEGFNVHRLKQYVAQNGSIAGYANGQKISREEFFGVQADLFVPAALENQIGALEAEALQVRLVAEGANGPCSPEGEAGARSPRHRALTGRACERGWRDGELLRVGAEPAQRTMGGRRSRRALEKAMLDAYERMAQFAKTHGCSNRIACYGVSLQRLVQVYLTERSSRRSGFCVAVR